MVMIRYSTFYGILQNKYTLSMTLGKPWVRIKITKFYFLQIELLEKETQTLTFDLMDSDGIPRVSKCLHISSHHSEDIPYLGTCFTFYEHILSQGL